jgi:hypothetical protein
MASWKQLHLNWAKINKILGSRGKAKQKVGNPGSGKYFEFEIRGGRV